MLGVSMERKTQVLAAAMVLSLILVAMIPIAADAFSKGKNLPGADGSDEVTVLAKGGKGGGSGKDGGGNGKGGGSKDGSGSGKRDTGFVTKVIGKDGGYIEIDAGIYLVVPPQALKADTEIGARMKRDKKDRKTKFYFIPPGLEFHRSAELQATWEAIYDAEEGEPELQYGVEIDGVVYDVGSPAPPSIETWGVRWKIDHFSLYYYRRR